MSEDTRAAGAGSPRVTPILAATAVVSAIAGFLYGYDTGIISGALLQITDEFRIGSGWQSVIATGILVGAVIMGCGMALFTQLSGIEMIVYYTPTILTGVGFEESGALLVSVALAVTYVSMNVVGLLIVDRVGRRRLSLIMTPGAALALVVLGVVFLTGTVSAGSAPFIIACLIAFMFFTAGGLQVMGWLTGSEIYPLGVRGAGTSAQSATLWGSNVLITLTLLPTIEIIGVGPTMWMYAGFNVLAFIFVWRYFPEVAGRSLEDIETSLREGTFHPGGVPIKSGEAQKAAT